VKLQGAAIPPKMSVMDTAAYVDTAGLARQLGLPEAWLKREAESGRIPSVLAGRRRMFHLAAVRQALDRQQQQSAGRECHLSPLREVAANLGVKQNWLRGEVLAGRIPAVQAGSDLLFDAETVETVLLERARAFDASVVSIADLIADPPVPYRELGRAVEPWVKVALSMWYDGRDGKAVGHILASLAEVGIEIHLTMTPAEAKANFDYATAVNPAWPRRLPIGWTPRHPRGESKPNPSGFPPYSTSQEGGQ
jgi:hypothetical protein